MADDEQQQLVTKLDQIAGSLRRISESLGAVSNALLTPKVQVMPPGTRGVATGVDASQAFLSGQWVRRGGDIWGPTPLGAKKRETR